SVGDAVRSSGRRTDGDARRWPQLQTACPRFRRHGASFGLAVYSRATAVSDSLRTRPPWRTGGKVLACQPALGGTGSENSIADRAAESHAPDWTAAGCPIRVCGLG